jgi:outer membrane receptor protein involved in Fe transport
VPNPNLRPETNETQEYGFGLRFDDLMLASDALEFKASYFDTKAKITSPPPSILPPRRPCPITSQTPKSGAGT